MLPWLRASSGAGCSKARTSVAVFACSSSLSTIPREWPGLAPSSKMVSVPSACRRASCCHENVAPVPIAKSLCLPPRRHTMAPVVRSILYTVDVLRAETSSVPSWSTSIELAWT